MITLPFSLWHPVHENTLRFFFTSKVFYSTFEAICIQHSLAESRIIIHLTVFYNQNFLKQNS